MFDLENAIRKWKLTFDPDGSLGADGVDEIETHLRESVDQLQRNGLSQHEALLVGLHRLGDSTDLEPEFAKNNPLASWRRRLSWMLGGYVALRIIAGMAAALSSIAGAALAWSGVDFTFAAPASFAVFTVTWLALLAFAYRAFRATEGKTRRFSWKWAMVAGAALAGIPWAQGIASIVTLQFVDQSAYGEMRLWLGCAGITFQVIWCTGCLLALYSLNKPVTIASE